MHNYLGVIAFMLLSSALPFYGKERTEVMQHILDNKYTMKGRRWKRVSEEAKAFVKTLLVSDPDQRLNAETALQSEWLGLAGSSSISPTKLKRRGPRTEEEQMARTAMLKYANYPKLKKMVRQEEKHSI